MEISVSSGLRPWFERECLFLWATSWTYENWIESWIICVWWPLSFKEISTVSDSNDLCFLFASLDIAFFFLPLLLSSRVPNSKSSYIERRKLLVDCNIHTFLNRIQRNLIKIKFSDKMLLSHRTEMDSLKRKCHQICMNLFRFGALFSLYHTSTQSAGEWKTLTEAVLHGILSQFLQRQYYSI